MESCLVGLGAEGETGPLFSGTYCILAHSQNEQYLIGERFVPLTKFIQILTKANIDHYLEKFLAEL